MNKPALAVGQKAPDFSLPNQLGETVSLKDYRGKWVVLYFYPRDNTPGCTMEAIDFSKLKSKFDKLDAVILGVSKDSCQSHQKFIHGKKLTIELLSDSDTKDTPSAVQKLYGVWRPKKFMGREFLGTIRSTFLINPAGIIEQVWDKVSAKGHTQKVLEELGEIDRTKVR
ncbi:MAG: thioredoxin-dependent thiol peroxidase [candidate division Zixibacteria bacterium]|nr:thioredoxin-dependent thiol peroxidase [candidate division Zixibacteria bacterium]